jgi:alginate O-acetyltransferase complex protein AlgI
MLFNSYVFIFGFLPLTLGVFFLLGRTCPSLVIPWLALASVGFYAWWDWRFVPLLLGSVLINFTLGKMLAGSSTPRCKPLLAIAVAINLGVLAYYKYFYFLIGEIGRVFNFTYPAPQGWVLPLGLSFFTFTQIAYLADVAKGHVREGKFWHYLLFVSYFPHLIAGPILHHAQMMPQFRDRGVLKPQADNVALGLSVFVIGLAKKVLLADTLAAYATPIFAAVGQGGIPDFAESWTGALGYTLQLYFDFSGYSDMAIGLSLLFNIRLPQNFNSPYRSVSIIDFWRRWHMTLAAFLRDYIYIPLGGNRLGVPRRYLNLMITMALGGIWHGAGWTFLIWGALHGIYLTINHAWRTLTQKTALEKMGTKIPLRLAYLILTFMCVVVGWVIFRAENMAGAMAILHGMIGQNGMVLPSELKRFLPFLPSDLFGDAAVLTQLALLQAWSMIAVGLAIVWFLPNANQWMSHYRICCDKSAPYKSLPLALVWQGRMWQAWLVGILFGLSLLSLTRVSEFLYFKF